MKKTNKKVMSLIDGRKIVLFVCSFMCLYLITSYVSAYKKVTEDIIDESYKGLSIDPNLKMRGLNLYIGEDEIYKFLRVPGGNLFINDSVGNHYYTLNSFLLGEIPVTNRLYNYVMKGEDVGSEKNSLEKYMYVAVSSKSNKEWETFIQKISEMTGHEFRLPTVAEWEYAARGGKASKGYKYAGSNNIDEVAVYKGNNEYKDLLLCKQKKPNELGFYDMSGLVSEITSNKMKDIDNTVKMYEDQVPDFVNGYISRGGFYNSDKDDCLITPKNKQTGVNTGARLVFIK